MIRPKVRYQPVRKSISAHGFNRVLKSISAHGLNPKERFKSEAGSISVIVIGLFVITVASLMVMTDVSSIIVAKRSLVQATEAAAQRGVQSLDKDKYYQGKGNMFTVPLAMATQRAHPVIPIDCTRGGVEVLLELKSWSSDESDMKWHQLKGIELTNFDCDGASLEISTRSEMKLPFQVPFSKTNSVFLTATAGTTNKVQEGFYLFGIRIN
jgi:zinc transporter ZupT